MNKIKQILVLIVMLSCTMNNKSGIINLEANSLGEQYGVIVIPLDGCSGCVNSVINLLENEKGKKNLHIIFTRCRSEKEARLKIGNLLSNRDNITIDTKNKFMKDHLVRDAPVFFLISNGSILKADTLQGELLMNKFKNDLLVLEEL